MGGRVTAKAKASCAHMIDGPMGKTSRGLRPWWRQRCRRSAAEGSDWCWQHGPMHVTSRWGSP